MKLLLAWLLGVPVSIAGMMNMMSVDLHSAFLGTERPRPVLQARCGHADAIGVNAPARGARGDCRLAAAAVVDLAAPRRPVSR